MSTTKKPVALAVGAALASGLMLSGSSFASTQLAQGYLLGAQGAVDAPKTAEGSCGADKNAGEGSCGADNKAGMEGKCGEGKCGAAAMDADKDGKVSRAEFTTAHADKAADFDKLDANKDGFLDAAEGKSHMEGKCGEGKCGADKKAEGAMKTDKAAEGKCGGTV